MDSNYSLSSLGALFNFGEENAQEPTERTRRLAVICIFIIVVFWTGLCGVIVYAEEYILQVITGLNHILLNNLINKIYYPQRAWWCLLILVLFGVVIMSAIAVLLRQPRNTTKLGFSTPFVPIVPVMSALINVFLMLTLSPNTWLRFLVWMLLGMSLPSH